MQKCTWYKHKLFEIWIWKNWLRKFVNYFWMSWEAIYTEGLYFGSCPLHTLYVRSHECPTERALNYMWKILYKLFNYTSDDCLLLIVVWTNACCCLLWWKTGGSVIVYIMYERMSLFYLWCNWWMIAGVHVFHVRPFRPVIGCFHSGLGSENTDSHSITFVSFEYKMVTIDPIFVMIPSTEQQRTNGASICIWSKVIKLSPCR